MLVGPSALRRVAVQAKENDHPLSLEHDSSWNEHHENQKLLAEIEKVEVASVGC